ncbi:MULTISPECIES: glycosyltransferase family 4 protein [unclassified Rathayibacter]|jgi:glycosyltransferase involved in cell wall biosynthesis|uniref:glycosyltransferase family 4 protein n=1 Tax=unclassified Rathayibacter TaxID=2609250 RepID=UPI000CE87D58|nr:MULTISPECIES: glycosyltransferase family 4 protein [unclassified Rathayibacter]PPG54029.1 glycosyl transferase family 1 [Rathayibacter sp. AY2B3]PPI27469.1 glycosyl transferase family 1 [Rathayibacter sp. AY1B5]
MTRSSDSIAVYDRARTVHLERFAHLGVRLVFRARNYDFDEAVAGRASYRRLGRVRTAVHLLRTPYRTVELNEPFQLNAWPGLLLHLAAIRTSDALRRRHTVVSAYAIGNDDLAANIAGYTRLPLSVCRPIAAAMMRLLVGGYDRIAFGIPAAEQVYRRLAGAALDGVRTRLFGALAPACTEHPLPPTRQRRLVFLGSLEARKGVEHLLRAWPAIADGADGASILGKGELAPRVSDLAESDDRVEFLEDPPGETIHARLAEASVLVLFSQRTPRWREQVGLPILEGLSHGCTVVASTETGIADWLRARGHTVLDADADPAALAHAIRAALERPLPVSQVLASLPAQDTRLDAAAWMIQH